MNAQPALWTYVRAHADGFYVNFIQMLSPSAAKCGLTAAMMTRKNAYCASDSHCTGLGGRAFGLDMTGEMLALDGSWTHSSAP